MVSVNNGQIEIDVALVRRLLQSQFPQWADLPIKPAVPQGWDNRTFRLGDNLSVRLPSAEGYTLQTAKEHRWLPFLAARLPLPVPAPVAIGQPNHNFPWQWSVYGWLDGAPARSDNIADMDEFAVSLAHFLTALQSIDPEGGPTAGQHSAGRGGPLQAYDEETRQAITALKDEIEADAVTAVWEAALAANWQHPPVWFHGDVAVNNLLVKNGRLCAVIDFGCCGVGDPACDTVIAWTLFEGASRAAFRAALPLDDATWMRGRGWALWKALITLVEYQQSNDLKATEARRIIREVLADYKAQN